MSKIVCIYHSRDLDGFMSAAIVKHWFKGNHQECEIFEQGNPPKERTEEDDPPETLVMKGWDYGDDIPDLSDYDRIIMTDISFPAKEMYGLYQRLRNNFIWIDHHTSAIDEIVNRFSDESKNLAGFRDIDFAACELTWMYFFDRKESDKMPEIIRLLGRYDCFGHKGTDEEQKVLEFQYGARAVINNYEEAYTQLRASIAYANTVGGENIPENIILEDGRNIYQYLCNEAKQIYSKAFPIKFYRHVTPSGAVSEDKYNFLCVNQERFNPINFDIDYHKDGYDGFACFWYKDNKWHFSLYNDNGEIDCSVIAKQYGGGGHKGAAGFKIDDINEFLKEL